MRFALVAPLVLLACSSSAPAPRQPPPSGPVSLAPHDASLHAGLGAAAPVVSLPRPVHEPLWTAELQTHGATALGDSIVLWSGSTCELRTVDPKTGATRRSAKIPKSEGSCNCELEPNALGCFQGNRVRVHRIADGKAAFAHLREDPMSKRSFGAGLGLVVDVTRDAGNARSPKLIGFDPQTGVDRWSRPLPAMGHVVAAYPSNVVVTSRVGGGSTVSAFEPQSGTPLWQKDFDTPHHFALDEHTFAVAGATIRVIDNRSGAPIGTGFPSPSGGAPARGRTFAITPSGTDLIFDVPDPAPGPHGTIVLATDRSGKERWRQPIVGWARTLAVSDGRVLVQVDHEELRVLDAATGAVAWRWFVRAHEFHVPKPGLLIVTENDTTYALDLANDLPQREITVRGHVDVQLKEPRVVRIVTSGVSVLPDAHGDFSFSVRGRGQLVVRAEVERAAIQKQPLPATKSARLASLVGGTCAEGNAVSIDVTDASPAPFVLQVSEQPCGRL